MSLRRCAKRRLATERTDDLSSTPRLARGSDGIAVRVRRILLVGGGFSTGNLGVSALSLGAISSLLRTGQGTEILIGDYGPGPSIGSIQIDSDGKNLTLQQVLFRFSKRFWAHNNILLLLLLALILRPLRNRKLHTAVLKYNATLEKLDNVDIVCSIAGGDSFSDLYGIRQMLYVSLPVLLGLALDKPVVLLPQTYGPYSSWIAKKLAHFILQRARLIYSRDLHGLQVVRDLIGSSRDRLHFRHDMAFYMKAQRPQTQVLRHLADVKGGGEIVGLNVSGLLFRNGYARDELFALKSSYQNLVICLLRYLVSQKGQRVLLIPHVLGNGNDSDSDQLACHRILHQLQEELGENLHYLSGSLNPQTVKYVIGQCEFFLGSRMHSCIAALSQGVPAVALAYSEKFVGVLKSVGAADLVLDLRHMDENEVLAKVDHIFRERSEIRKRLAEQVSEFQDSEKNPFLTDVLG